MPKTATVDAKALRRIRTLSDRLHSLADETTRVSAERGQAVRDLVATGVSMRTIATELGVSHVTVANMAKAGA